MYESMAAGISPPLEMPRMAVGCHPLARICSPSALMPSTCSVHEVAREGGRGWWVLVEGNRWDFYRDASTMMWITKCGTDSKWLKCFL